tara:strand:- start:1656 stop:1826 length:171 start_codon:yes stop_codon:yes gene_type:complete
LEVGERVEMPNKSAKQRKQKKAALNKKWKREGRTAVQHKRWLAKQPKNQNPIYGRR